MSARIITLSIDANDPFRLATFWAAALRWDVGDPDEGGDEVVVSPTDGTPFELLFIRVPDVKQGQNNLHLDLTTSSDDDQRDTIEQLLALGATRVDVGQDPEDTHEVLADPEVRLNVTGTGVGAGGKVGIRAR